MTDTTRTVGETPATLSRRIAEWVTVLMQEPVSEDPTVTLLLRPAAGDAPGCRTGRAAEVRVSAPQRQDALRRRLGARSGWKGLPIMRFTIGQSG